MNAFILCFLLITVLVQQNLGARTSQKIYVNVQAIRACFRRFNGTHQIGCASDRGGNVGVLHYVQTQEDVLWVMEHGPNSPYVVLLESRNFTRSVMTKLVTTKGRVNGVLVFTHNDTAPDIFSPDQSCPNNRYGMYSENKDYSNCQKVMWNEEAEDLMWRDWGFPITNLVSEWQVQGLIEDCYVKHNKPENGKAKSFPLCSVQIKTIMDGGKDTPTCIRRSHMRMNLNPVTYCDPLGDRNTFLMSKVVSSNISSNDTEIPDKSIIVAATRMDAFSMFDGMAPGGDTAVAGMVTLLAAVEALSNVKEKLNETSSKPIMFAFFHGEAFDYIGSSRMVYDMKQGNFPTDHLAEGEVGAARIRLRHLSDFLELNQVGLPQGGKLWLHSDPVSTQDPATKAGVEALSRNLTDAASRTSLTLDEAPADQPLPPASLQSFLKEVNISGVVITDHKEKYTNQYYNSRFDTAEQMNASYPPDVADNQTYDYITPAAHHLANLSSIVAHTLYKMATGEEGSLNININTVSHLLHCFLKNSNCSLFQMTQTVRRSKNLANLPLPLYVGVKDHYGLAGVQVRLLLAYYWGDIVSVSEEKECKAPDKNSLYIYDYMAGPWGEDQPFCVKSQANYSTAVSPAFVENNYNWSSGKYSSWSESQWPRDAMSVRYFMVPSHTRQVLTLCSGLGVCAVWMVIAFVINRNASTVFQPALSLA